jgi:WD40 repeat protein
MSWISITRRPFVPRSGIALAILLGLGMFNCRFAQAQAPKTLEGHTDPVYTAGFSSEGKWIVTAGFDKTLRIWDAAKRESVRTLNGHTGLVLALAISKDGKRIASGALDKTIKLWNFESDKSTHNLAGHGSQIYGLAFSPDGKFLASASNDKTVRLWDMTTHKQLRTISTQGGAVYAVAFTPDGKAVLTGGGDRTVRLINVENGKEIRQFTGSELAVYTVDVSPDGKTIIAAGVGLGSKRKITVWDIEKPQPAKFLEGHPDDVYRVQFNPKGNRLLSVGYSGTVNIWDVESGKVLFTTKLPVVTYGAGYSHDGSRIAVAANDSKAYLIDVPENAQ